MRLKEALQDKESTSYQIFDLVRFIFICLAIVVPVRIFIAQPFIVQGSSMVPTIENGEYFIVDRISYRINGPQRGDVVVLRPPHDPKTFYIKRVIGLPGETVSFQQENVVVTNGDTDAVTLQEPYINRPLIKPLPPVVLGEDEYYVMGDNRPDSQDSRYFGPLDGDKIVGRAWLRIFPLSKATFRPGDHRGQYLHSGIPPHASS